MASASLSLKLIRVNYLEALIKSENLGIYYKFLEKEQRISEMFELLEQLKDKEENFFQKYKEYYPTEAILFFKTGIEENLKSTGDEYYQRVATYLKHLKKLIDEEELMGMVNRLKSDYKRRRNFVKILVSSFRAGTLDE